jgi:LysR family transcriptional regulator, mexEF-oprN operon transcriptional activator
VNEGSLRKANLNLLVVFAVLMRERSITRSAKMLLMSQPAVSHSLKQLRVMFGDELFTRVSNGVTPTRWAESLYEDLLPSLEIIEVTLDRGRSTMLSRLSRLAQRKSAVK